MNTELMMLGWALLLAVAQTLLPAMLRTKEVGLPYAAGPRDRPAPVPPGVFTARLERARSNMIETLPIFVGAVLLVQATAMTGPLSHWGALIYFWARFVYVPLYAFGIPYLRTVAFFAATIGIVMVLAAALFGPAL